MLSSSPDSESTNEKNCAIAAEATGIRRRRVHMGNQTRLERLDFQFPTYFEAFLIHPRYFLLKNVLFYRKILKNGGKTQKKTFFSLTFDSKYGIIIK